MPAVTDTDRRLPTSNTAGDADDWHVNTGAHLSGTADRRWCMTACGGIALGGEVRNDARQLSVMPSA